MAKSGSKKEKTRRLVLLVLLMVFYGEKDKECNCYNIIVYLAISSCQAEANCDRGG
jgi:hypothetical protein